MTQLVGKQEGHIQLRLAPAIALSDDQLFELCQINRELRIERSSTGELVIMSPAGRETGARNASLTGQLWWWNRNTKLGQSFDSSAGFVLANGAVRSPDAAWMRRERWESLTRQEKQKFAPGHPDFVAELRSATDSLAELQLKMQEYLDNGVALGWLIDPQNCQVWIYRPELEPEVLSDPTTLSDPLLPGFVLDVQEVFRGF